MQTEKSVNLYLGMGICQIRFTEAFDVLDF